MKLIRREKQTQNPKITSSVLTEALKNERGMTLVEIMIVVTIMASIMGVVGFFVFGSLETANKKQAVIQMRNYHQFVESYYMATDPHQMPETLDDLVTQNVAKEIKPDPWGNDYIYRKNSGLRDFEIFSAGPDGMEGTEDDVHID